MQLFHHIIIQIIPLCFHVIAGFIAGRVFSINRQDIAKLALYILTPIAAFYGAMHAHISNATLMLPLAVYIICAITALVSYILSKRIWKDSRANIAALSCISSNSGYFSIPVALFLLDKKTFGVYTIAMLGVIIFQFSLGFLISARSNFNILKAITEFIKLPVLYAFALGLFFNQNNLALTHTLTTFIEQIQSSYTVIAMMIIGLGLSTIQVINFDFKFIAMALATKFLILPLIALLFIYLDHHHLNTLNMTGYKVLILISTMPIAANNVVFASIHQTYPDKVSCAVLFSTIFSLFYIPMVMSLI